MAKRKGAHRIPHPVNPEILEILIQTISHSDRYGALRYRCNCPNTQLAGFFTWF
ncbi:MAG: hypothetical protein HEQ20_04395 [Aphanizomenon flos-aquae KM1D3_PB]|uniref:hypothetical protein n=1 Tax=Aphanizomenon flos-aquae TaxID=1176 RepID=UPI000A6DA5A3|nr:hypothetical protein [Aphanizomenon flos-aquae]QSV70145.1 MAG: hypothetical protein HEQ20_04395 [Aphanizomenon flos-aquae KM1D3_PB]